MTKALRSEAMRYALVSCELLAVSIARRMLPNSLQAKVDSPRLPPTAPIFTITTHDMDLSSLPDKTCQRYTLYQRSDTQVAEIPISHLQVLISTGLALYRQITVDALTFVPLH